ncbi:T9SS type A sorting domain-containing protein [Neolewinella lacunae]|uniref:T9SS type A sorting domain-containing protein n=1 Tax=Neolewinella lacunae TaxID=1517758 RepID=A0A923PLD3_9BACT|nr:T9SS type A sorting domain-containing protein [Neolewinella lacunae]MBC6993348.1 T9SS type A sorting domain-containing protein [Neolewinella lacunae]MDN3636338.1 T9SS type A sorting domain-containing protein [Neolewinella lacunae]
MKGLLITLLAALTFALLPAQNVEWERTYPNYLTLGKALSVDADNNIISVSNGFSLAGFAEYIYVQKHSPQGTLIWKDSISSNLASNYQAATWVGTDANQDIFIVGYRFTLSNQFEVPNALKVIKFSSGGALLQNQTITGFFNRDGNTNLGRRNESMLDETGNLYVASAGATSSQSGGGFVLLKFDNDANLLWERIHTFSNVHGLRGMHCQNGKIAVLGTTSTTGTDNKVAVWDENGNFIWSSAGINLNQSWATDVLVDASGNTYTLCQKFGSSYNLVELTKYSPTGGVLFAESFDLQVSATSGRMAKLPNGNIVISGTNWTSFGTGKLFVAQVSALNGAIINSSLSDLPQTNNWVYDVTTAPSGNYYVAGQSDNNGGAPSSMFLYAFSDLNGLEWSASYNTQGVKPMSVKADADENIYVQIENTNTVVKFGNSALPVALSRFEATLFKKEVFLDWTTERESNCALFAVQKSPNGTVWTTFAQTPAAGTTTATEAYQAIDHSPFDGTNYYRLKMIDVDQTFEYSSVVRVAVKRNAQFSVFPNPTTGFISVEGEATALGQKLRVFSLRGNLVYQQELFGASSLDLSFLPNGVYVLNVGSTSQRVTIRK